MIDLETLKSPIHVVCHFHMIFRPFSSLCSALNYKLRWIKICSALRAWLRMQNCCHTYRERIKRTEADHSRALGFFNISFIIIFASENLYISTCPLINFNEANIATNPWAFANFFPNYCNHENSSLIKMYIKML